MENTNTPKLTDLGTIAGDEVPVITFTGKAVHAGTAGRGYVQTRCGIGYGKRAAGRAIAEAVTCERCLAMAPAAPAAEVELDARSSRR